MFLQLSEKDLINEDNNLLRIEEDYWKIRSHINWINDDDANTKFFYISIVNQRCTNNIVYFKNSEGSWITDLQQILNYTFNRFENAFISEHIVTPRINILDPPTSFDIIDLTPLDHSLQDYEIVWAIFPSNHLKHSAHTASTFFTTKNIGIL